MSSLSAYFHTLQKELFFLCYFTVDKFSSQKVESVWTDAMCMQKNTLLKQDVFKKDKQTKCHIVIARCLHGKTCKAFGRKRRNSKLSAKARCKLSVCSLCIFVSALNCSIHPEKNYFSFTPTLSKSPKIHLPRICKTLRWSGVCVFLHFFIYICT